MVNSKLPKRMVSPGARPTPVRLLPLERKERFSDETIGTSRGKARCKCPLPRAPTVGVFCTDKNRVVKITCSSSEMVLQTTKHTNLSWFRLLLGGYSPTSSDLILKMNNDYNGVSKELEKFTW
jgi:hypothetical protein